MAVSGQTVLIALAIDFGIGLGAFIIFSILRIIKPTNRYYDPRTFYGHTLGGVHAATGTATAGTANNLQPSSAAVQQSSENAEQWLSQDPSALSNTDSTGSAHTDVAAVENQSFQERNDSTNTLQAAANTQGLTAAALSSSGPPPPDEGGMPRPGGPLPPRLPGTLLTWIVPLLQLSEARVVATVGLDVAMLLRFIRFALRVLVLVIIWCVGVVLPINYTGTNLITAEQIQEATASVPTTPAISAPPTVVNDNFLGQLIPTITVPGIGNSTNTTGGSGGGAGAARVQLGPGEDVTSLAEQIESGRYVASDLDRFSMANIPAGSPLLWVHLASVYVVTAITLKLLWSATSDALQLYLHHLSSNSANLDSATHTALLTDIPGVSKGTLPDKVLHNCLFKLLPAAVKRRIRAAWEQLQANTAQQFTSTIKKVIPVPGSLVPLPQQQQQQAEEQQQMPGHPQLQGRRSTDHHQQQQLSGGRYTTGNSNSVEEPGMQVAAVTSIHQPQAYVKGREDVRINIQESGPAASPANDVNDTYVNQTEQTSRQCHPKQQQQQQQLAQLPDVQENSALARALAGSGDRIESGRHSRFSDEWQRAAVAMAAGLSLKEFVLRVFKEVYGPDNVVAAHIVTYSQSIASLVQQYNTTHTALADLLDSYNGQLRTAAAAAAAVGRQHGLIGTRFWRLKRPAMEPVPIKMLPADGANQAQAASSKRHEHDNGGSSSNGSNSSRHESVSSNSKGGLWPFKRKAKHDAMDVLLNRLEYLSKQLSEAQTKAKQDPAPSAFITFRTRTALVAAVSSHHVAEAGAWLLQSAPPPDNVMWNKLGLRFWERGFRRGIVQAVLGLVAFFYVVPVAVVQGILQLDRLQRTPVIGTLVNLPVVRSLLLGVLPGLALRIFVLLLPVLLYAINRRAGSVGVADMDGRVATHFFFLQVVIVFFASFITGSLLNQLSVLFTQGAGPVLDRLGTGAPQTANFFILYIIFSAFIGRALSLLRPWGLLMTFIRVLSANKYSRRARRRAVVVGTYRMFGPSVPEQSMILLLGLVLCIISPFVAVAAFVYFCMALLVEKYNWVWVFRRPYEGGGRLWQQLFRHVFVALYLFQLVMAALLIVKRFVWVPLLIPIFLITLLVHRIGSALLQRSWRTLSMRAAYDLDVEDAREEAEAIAAATSSQHQQQYYGHTAAVGATTDDRYDQQLWRQQQSNTNCHWKTSNPVIARNYTAAVTSDSRLAALVEQRLLSQVAAWSDMYRPPAVQLLVHAPELHASLKQRIAAMQARLAAHNAAAEAQQAGNHAHHKAAKDTELNRTLVKQANGK